MSRLYDTTIISVFRGSVYAPTYERALAYASLAVAVVSDDIAESDSAVTLTHVAKTGDRTMVFDPAVPDPFALSRERVEHRAVYPQSANLESEWVSRTGTKEEVDQLIADVNARLEQQGSIHRGHIETRTVYATDWEETPE